ncbi:MAG: hypothetical protein H6581_19875 [Bacteroidia bacterium]|nr:hypothetical protein [Bacteroidia bacterium]
MKNKQIVQILQSFGPNHIRDFRDYLDCRLFNERKILGPYLELIQKLLLGDHPEDPEIKPVDFGAYLQLRGDSEKAVPYTEGTIHKLASELKDKFFEFLAIITFRKNLPDRLLHTYKAFLSIPNHYDSQRIYEEIKRKFDESEDQDAAYFQSRFEFQFEFGRYIYAQVKNIDLTELFEGLNHDMRAYYLTRKLEILNGNQINSHLFNQSYSIESANWVLLTMMSEQKKQPTITRIYHSIYRMNQTRRRIAYVNLRDMLLARNLKVPIQDLQSFFAFILNYCFSRLNEGKFRYKEDIDRIYRHMLEEGLILHEKNVSRSHLKNIITFYCVFDQVAFAEDILESHLAFVSDPLDGAVGLFLRSYIALFKKDYSACIRGMDEVTPALRGNPFFLLDAQETMIKASMERAEDGDLAFARNLLEACRKRIEAIDLTDSRKEPYRNFRALANKLNNHLSKEDFEKKTDFQRNFHLEIKKCLQLSVSNRIWLLKMVKERN